MHLLLSVGVGANRSKAGKTTFIENFIKFVKEVYHEAFVITVKYTKTSLYSSITTESSVINTKGKDTERMKTAGADIVYWVKATEEDLPEVVDKLKEDIFSCLQNDERPKFIIIEGNSMVKALQPDVIIFFKDKFEDSYKPSAKAILEMADIVIEGEYSMEDIMKDIEGIQKRKFIEKHLKERSNNGKITCSEARKIAEDLNVPYIEVGKMANELKIKIRNCELGCF
ncbi:MAG: hypothetical protein ABDH19_06775 [Thermodesulfovibrio sp.]